MSYQFSGCKSAVRRPSPELGGSRCESCHPDQIRGLAQRVWGSRCQRGYYGVRVPLPAPFAPAAGTVDGLLSRRCGFDSYSGTIPSTVAAICVRGGIGIRTTLRTLALWVQIPPNAPIGCPQLWVAGELYKLARSGRLPGTAGFDSLADDQLLPTDGLAACALRRRVAGVRFTLGRPRRLSSDSGARLW